MSAEFQSALTAEAYFDGRNTTIMARRKLALAGSQTVHDSTGGEHSVPVQQEVRGATLPSNFFFRFVVQQNQFLLANGLQTGNEADKKKLGASFDKTLEQIGENALVHGVCWAFWNAGRLEMIEACKNPDTGFVALVDERTSEPRVGIQFWRIAPDKPLYLRIFEMDGVSLWRVVKDATEVVEPKRAYRQRVRKDAFGERVVGEENYPALPVVPLYANKLGASELTESIRQKLDAYDIILSDFSDNLERTNDIYWVINNFGGTTDEIIAMLAEINRIKATYTESSGLGQSTAEPHTIEVPYQARSTALELLEKALYRDYMALDMGEITGGSLTNVAIKAAMTNLNLKADRYEWQVFAFCQKLLRLVGVETEEISFKRQTIANESEIVQDIYTMRADINQRKALELNPYIPADEIDGIIDDTEAEKVTGMASVEKLEKEVVDDEEADDAEEKEIQRR